MFGMSQQQLAAFLFFWCGLAFVLAPIIGRIIRECMREL